MPELIAEDQDSRDYVNSLARGLEVIRAFTRVRPRMTLSEVAQQTDLSRAAARRFLLTLVREGYAETDGKFFRLRPKVLELGYSVLASMDISEIMQPILNDLADRLQESCFAAVLDGDHVVYVAGATSQRVVKVGIDIGSRVPAYCVSTGRVLLAGLGEDELEAYLTRVKLERFTPRTVSSKVKLRGYIEDVRRQGWAFVDQELELGLGSVAVPINDRAGAVVAALNVACPSPRVTPEYVKTGILTELFASAQQISLALPASTRDIRRPGRRGA